MIRSAHREEAAAVSELAFRSKSHWPYTPEQLEVFRLELTISQAQLIEKRGHVFEGQGELLGFYTLAVLNESDVELEHIFVEPEALGRGIGSQLFDHACETARDSGAKVLVIQSDPNAAGFYHTLGATLVREIPSSIPGGSIPYFTYPLASPAEA